MDLFIDSSGFDVDIHEERHEAFLRDLLQAAGEVDCELSVTLIDDQEIRDLNYEHRGVDKPTDVLSFSLREGEVMGQQRALGDIVISVEMAERQADMYGHSLDDEIDELLFHGVIHLLGYDHEGRPEEWMKKEKDLLESLRQMELKYSPKGLILSGENENNKEGGTIH